MRSHPTIIVALVCLSAPGSQAQGPAFLVSDDRVHTIVGTGSPGYSGDGGPATKATMNEPAHCSFGPRGEMYIVEAVNHVIRRVDPDGTIHTVAGCGSKGYDGDGGPATKAHMNEPYGVLCDRKGNLYVVDRLNAVVRRVDGRSGIITTIAGTGGKDYSGDGGPAVKAQMREPHGIAMDSKEQKLYVADVADCRIRVVDLRTGMIQTFAGNGKRAFAGDNGPAAEASIHGARAVAVDRKGFVYICEREGNRVRMVDPKSGVITTIAGTGKSGNQNGPPLVATFNGPKWLAMDEKDGLYIVDTENHAVRRLEVEDGLLSTIIGGAEGSGGDGGPPLEAKLARPHGCCIYKGILYVADTENHRIRACRVPPAWRDRK